MTTATAPVRYMEIDQLAGCDVWLTDGTHVIFTLPGGKVPGGFRPTPPPAQPAMREAFQRARR